MQKWLLAVFVFATPSFAAGPGPSIVPLADVRPGMEGHGIGPIHGKDRERFLFRVVNVEYHLDPYYPYITVEVFSDASHRVEPGLVIGGMSGSPLYVGDRLLGAIARSPTFQRDSKAHALPAEFMMGPVPDGVGDSPYVVAGDSSSWQPGESYIYCSTWGDVNRCSGATITATGGDGFVRAQAHDTGAWGEDEKDGLRVEQGPVTMPVWRATVFGQIPMIDSSTVVSGASGSVAAALVWDGEFGHIIRTDRRPVGIPVNLTMPVARERTIRRAFQVAYSPHAPQEIIDSLKGLAKPAYGTASPLMIRVSVKVRGIEESFRMQDMLAHWSLEHDQKMTVLHRLLQWILVWSVPQRHIERIDAEILPATAELYVPTTHKSVVADGALTVRLSLQRDRDYAMFSQSATVPSTACTRACMLVTGGWVQRGVLASAPLEEAVAAFNEVETTSEYLVTTTFEPAPVRTTPFAPEGLTPEPKRAAARILARFGGSGVVVFVEDDDPTVVEPPEK